MIPAFRLLADSKDITDRITPLVEKITVTDHNGMQADELSLSLFDSDGTLPWPTKGMKLEVWLGFAHSLVPMGAFLVNEWGHDGGPDMLTITARAADLSGDFLMQREQSWHQVALGDILRSIAERQNLEPAIHQVLASIHIDHIDQTNESDANFLTRLGQEHDALASVKAGRLLFVPDGQSLTASGKSLDAITINRADCLPGHSFTMTDREQDLTGIRAMWRDKAENQRRYSTAGNGEKWKTLKKEFPNAVTAHRAAKAEWAKLQRGQYGMTIKLPVGNPLANAGRHIRLTGWRDEISAIGWYCQKAVHQFDTRGFTTDLDLTGQ